MMVQPEGKIALVFPGQGCQYVGLGTDLYEASDEARAMYERADEVLGFSLSRLIFEGPKDQLDDTANTQPAIYTATLALWRALAPHLTKLLPRVACVAGHSLGEFSALAVAGVVSFEDGLRLVRCRGEAMRDVGAQAPGGLAAILGLSDQVVAEIVAEANNEAENVWIANYNAPGQVVIAGERDALERALALAQRRKPKRIVPLAVSVVSHTPIMRNAAERLAAALEATTFRRPWAPVISNATASPLMEPARIKEALVRQLTSPVRWVESVHAMVKAGVQSVIEVGPRAVLCGLIRRIHRPTRLHSVTDMASLKALTAGSLGQ